MHIYTVCRHVSDISAAFAFICIVRKGLQFIGRRLIVRYLNCVCVWICV